MSAPYRVLVHGAGRMACTIADTLAADPRYDVRLSAPEPDPGQPRPVLHPAVQRVDGHLSGAPGPLLAGVQALIMAGEVWAGSADVARLAREAGCHYLDIAESPESARAVAAIAEGARGAFVPACGLAPGYVTALASEFLERGGEGARLTVHVGVLPARRTNRLGYGNLLGVDGLLVEYTSPCLAIRGGTRVTLPPLAERETLHIGGEEFESFTTAGTLDALVEDPGLRAQSLVFKTLRYPGHLDYMRFLLDDLGLARQRSALRGLLLNGLPRIDEDRVLIVLDLDGPGGPLRFEQVLPARALPGGGWASAGIAATAAHVCAVTDLLCTGALPRRGFVAQGSVGLGLLRRSAFFAPLTAVETVTAEG